MRVRLAGGGGGGGKEAACMRPTGKTQSPGRGFPSRGGTRRPRKGSWCLVVHPQGRNFLTAQSNLIGNRAIGPIPILGKIREVSEGNWCHIVRCLRVTYVSRPREKWFFCPKTLEGFRLSCRGHSRWIPGTGAKPICATPCPLSPPPSLPHAQHPAVALTQCTGAGGKRGASRCGKGGGRGGGPGMEPGKPRLPVPGRRSRSWSVAPGAPAAWGIVFAPGCRLLQAGCPLWMKDVLWNEPEPWRWISRAAAASVPPETLGRDPVVSAGAVLRPCTAHGR